MATLALAGAISKKKKIWFHFSNDPYIIICGVRHRSSFWLTIGRSCILTYIFYSMCKGLGSVGVVPENFPRLASRGGPTYVRQGPRSVDRRNYSQWGENDVLKKFGVIRNTAWSTKKRLLLGLEPNIKEPVAEPRPSSKQIENQN